MGNVDSLALDSIDWDSLHPRPRETLRRTLTSPFINQTTQDWIDRQYDESLFGRAKPWRQVEIAGTDDEEIPVGKDTIRVRVYHPVGNGPFPIHIYYHGGGWMVGSAFYQVIDNSMRARCDGTGSIVVNVDYRLAPQHRFPVGVEDSYAALEWVAKNAASLNGNPDLISVGGTSSGGNFAAAVALMSRDRSGPKLILQLIEMGALDLTLSSHLFRTDPTRAAEREHLSFYLRSAADQVNPYASPLLAADLSGVAPAYLMSAEFDRCRDECEAYAARLGDFGVEAVARLMKGHVHGSADFTDDWEPARRWHAEADAVIRRANVLSPGPLFAGFDPDDDSAIDYSPGLDPQ